jgi:hypothetical protein
MYLKYVRYVNISELPVFGYNLLSQKNNTAVEFYIIPAPEILHCSTHTNMPIFVLEKTPFPMDEKFNGPNPFQTQTEMKNSHFSHNDQVLRDPSHMSHMPLLEALRQAKVPCLNLR